MKHVTTPQTIIFSLTSAVDWSEKMMDKLPALSNVI